MRYVSAHRANNRTGRPDPNGTEMRYGSIASFNRWTHQPHEHKRAIARRLRQEKSSCAK